MMRIAIVGTAFGESRCRMVHDVPDHATLVAVCGRDPRRTAEVAVRQDCAAVTDYRELVKRDDIDAVGIFTSTDVHTEIAIAAAEAGKHVIVSKPTAVSIAAGEAMLKACRDNGVRLVVEFDTRYTDCAYRIWRAIADGSMGPVIQGDYVNKTQRPDDYYQANGGWRKDPARGGGTLFNQGVHAVDHLLWYQGAVEGVFALSGTFAHDMPAEDTAVAAFRFRNGSIATYTAATTYFSGINAGRYGGAGTLKRAQVHGSLGSATMEGLSITNWVVPDSASPSAIPEVPPRNVFEDVALSLADPGRQSPTLVEGKAAIESVYVTEALRRSAATGRYVTIEEVMRPGK